MGKITITVEGSFPDTGTNEQTALDGGHAAAIGRSMQILIDMLPAAIALDHKLHDAGELPPNKPFGEGPTIGKDAKIRDLHQEINTMSTKFQERLKDVAPSVLRSVTTTSLLKELMRRPDNSLLDGKTIDVG